MSIAEMKQKINKKADEFDEVQLQIVIDVIEKIDNMVLVFKTNYNNI